MVYDEEGIDKEYGEGREKKINEEKRYVDVRRTL